MPKMIRADGFILKVAKIIEIDSNRIRRIVIDAKFNQIVLVYVEMVGDERMLDIKMDKSEIKIMNVEKQEDEK